MLVTNLPAASTAASTRHAEARLLQTAPPPLCGPAAGVSTSLTVDGWVNTPTTYSLSQLQALPQTTETDPFFAATTQKFTGVPLYQLLGFPEAGGSGLGSVIKADTSGPQGASQKNDLTRFSVMVTGSDCFQALFSAAELDPFWSGTTTPGLLALAEGDETMTGPATGPIGTSGANGDFRMIMPSDAKGSRRVSNVVEITVLAPPPETDSLGTNGTCAANVEGVPSTSLSVSDWVNTPTTYNATQLAAQPNQSTVDDPFFGTGPAEEEFTGVSLSNLLGFPQSSPSPANNNGLGSIIAPDNPGPQAPSAQKNDLTRFGVMVTGDDCFQAFFSAAELDPFWAGPAQPPIIAYAESLESQGAPATGPLGTSGANGFARMIIPTDAKGSRRVSNVVDIQVISPSSPVITWATPADITAGTPLDSTQLDASAPVGGAFTYTPAAGTVLGQGQQQLRALFVPTPGSNYTLSAAAVELQVDPPPVVPEVPWVPLLPISAGVLLLGFVFWRRHRANT